ncbi:ABC transporter ATP-binding protein [Anaerophilus nitritogenes]|uniref:ABC transporter ATP-binding protein n=1 Tax=Anaerophilus nitritogenes TaxID=2498136 RepID=UPI001930F6ED|nr:ATP-binding cassette domain-containing protein [Anaerophilus nitritogenes]
MKEVAVQTHNLIKTFSGVDVIKNYNMTVLRGSIYGLLGANGAGKTTAFKILSGLLVPIGGKAEVLGKDIVSQRDEVLKNIGTIIETPIFYEHLPAKENLEIHLSYMGIENVDIASVLEAVDLQSTNRHPVSKYSLGMRQRLGIARALSHKPQLLILDEPTNGLDPMGIRKMRELFLKLVKEENMTILISSHILSEIQYIADMIGVMVNGTIIEEVPLETIKKQYPDGLEDYFFNIMDGGQSNA